MGEVTMETFIIIGVVVLVGYYVERKIINVWEDLTGQINDLREDLGINKDTDNREDYL
jgi:hypothetical protein